MIEDLTEKETMIEIDFTEKYTTEVWEWSSVNGVIKISNRQAHAEWVHMKGIKQTNSGKQVKVIPDDDINLKIIIPKTSDSVPGISYKTKIMCQRRSEV